MRLPGRSSSAIEAASAFATIGIVALLELQWSVVTGLGSLITSWVPILQGQSVALFAGCWIGLMIYSVRRRRESSAAKRQNHDLEQSLEISKIADPVTGLPNQRGFDYYLKDQMEKANFRAISVLGIEIINLETLRNVHGSDVADEIIAAFAEALVTSNLPIAFCARGSQSNFYLVFQQSTKQHQQEYVARLIEQIKLFSRTGVRVQSMQLNLYVCFGILALDTAAIRAQRWDSDGVLRRVDYAIRAASRNGNESVREFDEQMEQTRRRRTIIEASLRDAIYSGQIQPQFQPFIDLKTSKIVGFEVLSRWQHPTEGSISPTIFIPIAEEMGLLRKLTVCVLDQVCAAAKPWPADLKLAVNISPTDLKNESMIVELLDVLRRYKFDPSRIELEITENAFIEEIDAVNNIVDRLKTEGLTISIDDFGTGYSSLQHLKSLPFDKIKIDQSFIRDMATNAESNKIVQAIIALANSLGVPTTAEGIELDENLDELEALGCTFGQGYLFAKALTQEEVPAFIARFERELSGADFVAAEAAV